MAKFDGLTIWTDAFIGDTLDLTTEEIGAYFLLLMAAWRTPTCDLPDDDNSLSRFARCRRRHWSDHMRSVMLRFWQIRDGRWVQKRLLRERETAEKRALKAFQASLSRWGRTDRGLAENDELERVNRLNSLNGEYANASFEHNGEHMLGECLDDASRARVPAGIEEGSKKISPSAHPKNGVPPVKPSATKKPPTHSLDLIGQAVGAWNTTCGPTLGRVVKITDARRRKLAKRVAEDFDGDLSHWRAYAQRIAASPFLTGENDRGWRADFDWAIELKNITRVIEGRYDPRVAKSVSELRGGL